jgi:hypothetical protein
MSLCESEVPALKSLIKDFEYPLTLFKKNMNKMNLLSSQYELLYLNIGKYWCNEYLDYVKENCD